MSKDYFIDYLLGYTDFNNDSDDNSSDEEEYDEYDLIDPDWGKDEDNDGYVMDECGHWSVC